MVDIICTTIWSDKLFFSQKLIVTSFVGITHFIVPHWLIGSEGKVNWSVNSMSLLPRSISLCQICQMLFHQLHLYEVQKKIMMIHSTPKKKSKQFSISRRK